MIRVLTGRGWRFNPQLLAELRAGSGRGPGRLPPIMDVLGVEVDGVDLFAGLSEDRIIEVTADLAIAAARLASGYRRAQVTCSGGAVELLLERRDARISLSLVRVRRPSMVLVDGLDIELSALVQAILRSATGLLDDLRKIHPALLEGVPAQQLMRALTGALRRPPRAQPRSAPLPGPGRALSAQGHVDAAGFRLSLDDSGALLESFAGGRSDLLSLLVPGRFVLETGAELPPWSSEQRPFLLLRDLVQSGLEAMRSLEQGDTEHEVALDGTVTLLLRTSESTPPVAAFARETSSGQQLGLLGFQPCPPAPLLSAVFEAALAFGTLAIRQNGRQGQNAPLVMLLAEAREGLARSRELAATPAADAGAEPLPRLRSTPAPEPRLGPGKLKLLSYREAWRHRAGTVRRLSPLPRAVIVEGEAGIQCLAAADGAVRWSVDEDGARHVLGRRGAIFVADSRGLTRRDAAGTVAWHAASPNPLHHLALAAEDPIDVVATSDGREVLAFAADRGTALWRFSPPTPGRLGLLGVRGRLLVWTGDERLYCVSPVRGQLLWRSRGRPVSQSAIVGERILVAAKSYGGLRALSLRTGKGEALPGIDFDRVGGAVRLRGLTVLAALESDQGRVLALRRNGKLAWAWTHDERLGPAMPLLCPLSDGILVRTARTLCRLDLDGTVRWSHPLSEQTHDGLPPTERRGIAFAAGDAGLFAFDAETGNVLGQLDAEPPIAALAIDSRLDVYVAEEAAPVRALRVQRFLSVV